MNFLVHSYTCCSDRHASPYWTFIHRWISMGFTTSLLKKRNYFRWERSHSCTRSRRVCYRRNVVHELPSPLYTCCSDRHASSYWTFIRRWISIGFTTSLLKKRMTDAVLLWCMLQAGPPSLHYYCAVVLIPASYCHLSATLQTMSITVVNLQDNRATFRIFIALLRFSFDSPSHIFYQCQDDGGPTRI